MNFKDLFSDSKPLKTYTATFYYKSGEVKKQNFVAYDFKTAKYQTREYIRNGFAYVDGDELVRCSLK